ncbi:hypothetical protein FHW37_10119 [Neorhizobium alkalisoli]|uniref:Uncharacterized protein n=1 Tax=Neorhizobium alkalisoli TaxID=528178 RepID=A0A561R6I8_9HYPH|nr:hypothetical protein FHW37_10119 [Neorhizobium alkalisoli]
MFSLVKVGILQTIDLRTTNTPARSKKRNHHLDIGAAWGFANSNRLSGVLLRPIADLALGWGIEGSEAIQSIFRAGPSRIWAGIDFDHPGSMAVGAVLDLGMSEKPGMDPSTVLS